MAKYNPKPVDTSSVQIDPSLLELIEYLAKNTHEVWANGRVREGWEFGPRRDDAARQHPGLVPYEHLTESEKTYDRATATETIKLIQMRGYVITPPFCSIHPDSADVGKSGNPSSLNLAQMVEIWTSLGPGRCHGGPEIYLSLGQRALELGEYLLANDILKEGRRYYPSEASLRQREALAKARQRRYSAASKILEELIAEGNHDEETLGLLGRCYKDLWEQAADPADARASLVKACDAYESAYSVKAGYWPAINVATLAECLGDRVRSSKFAVLAKDECLRQLGTMTEADDRYWLLATMGEACLVLDEAADAERYYVDAAKVAAGRYGNISATRKNIRLIVQNRGINKAAQMAKLHQVLDLPRVVVFAGHRIDAPNRPSPRFPAELEGAVRDRIKAALADLNCGFGYASAANGADILFLEEVLARGGEANIVLPYEAQRFCASCVAIQGTNWEARFKKLLAAPGVRIVTTSQGPVDEGLAHEYANNFTFGLAGIRAWQLGAELAPLAVSDWRTGDGPGGTADAVARWRACDCHATVIETGSLLDAAGIKSAPIAAVPTQDSTIASASDALTIKPRMAAMVFADLVGYTQLIESDMPLYITHMLRSVVELAATRNPLHVSTWGDAFYFVFDNVLDAGQFALDLRDKVETTDWRQLGFSKRLALRTALHVGPVHGYTNPTTGKPDFIGTHVSRASRIEPITPEGHVYASEIFAAIAFAERADGFRCEYVGKIGLPKDYGNFPVYHVRRNTKIALKK